MTLNPRIFIVSVMLFTVFPLHFVSSIIPYAEFIRIVFFDVMFLILLLQLYKAHGSIKLNPYTVIIGLLIIYMFVHPLDYTYQNRFFWSDTMKMIYIMLFSVLVLNYNMHDYFKYIQKLTYILFIAFLANIFFANIGGLNISPESGKVVISGFTGRAITGFCALALMILTLFLIENRMKYGYLMFLTLAVIIVFSSTRIALPGMILAFIYIIIRKRLYIVAAIAMFPVLFLIGKFAKFFIMEMFISEDIEFSFSNIWVLIDNIRLTGRLYIWELTLANWDKSVYIGNGWGSNNFFLSANSGIEQTHNDYLRILADLGYVGIFLYVGLFVYILYYSFKSNLVFGNYTIIFTLSLMAISFTDNLFAYSVYLLPFLVLLIKGIKEENKIKQGYIS